MNSQDLRINKILESILNRIRSNLPPFKINLKVIFNNNNYNNQIKNYNNYSSSNSNNNQVFQDKKAIIVMGMISLIFIALGTTNLIRIYMGSSSKLKWEISFRKYNFSQVAIRVGDRVGLIVHVILFNFIF